MPNSNIFKILKFGLFSLIILMVTVPIFISINSQNAKATSQDKLKKIIEENNLNLTINTLNKSQDANEINKILNKCIRENKSELIFYLYENCQKYYAKKLILNFIEENMTSFEELNLISFLKEVSLETYPAFAQKALILLQAADQDANLDNLVEHLSIYNTASYQDGEFVKLSIKLLDEIYKKAPESRIAKGIKELNKIYEINVLNYNTESANLKNLVVEENKLENLTDWLEKYNGHPLTSLVNYSLAKIYETGQDNINALNFYYLALKSPGNLDQQKISKEFLFLLDVKSSRAELATYSTSVKIIPEVKPIIIYTRAIKLARDHNYEKALSLYQYFVNEYKNKDLFILKTIKSETGKDDWNFWKKVSEQQVKMTELHAYSTQIGEDNKSAPLRYKIASLIYHDSYIFYNHFWQGEKQPVATGNDEFLVKQNNYFQALIIFKELKNMNLSPELAEKVDFSIVQSYMHLYTLGEEINLIYSEEDLQHKTITATLDYISKYPEGLYKEEANKIFDEFNISREYKH